MEHRDCYQGIDIVKFIMALLIVVLHTHPLIHINDTLSFLTADVLGRVAVPFFFTATGFLLEKRIALRKEKTKGVSSERTEMEIVGKYIKKVLILYCIWTLIYLPIILYDKFVISYTSVTYALFTMIRDFLFHGSYVHLWYLPASAVGLVLVYLLRKYAGEYQCAIIVVILFCMGLLTQSYFGFFLKIVSVDGMLWKIMKLLKKVMVTCRNGIFFGSIFIYMGTWIARHDIKMKKRGAVVGFVISVIFLYVEESFLQKAGFVREPDMYLLLIPATFFLMLTALGISVKADTMFFRKMSTNIYFVHMIFKFIYRIGIGEYDEIGMGMFVFSLCGALAASYIMYRFWKKCMFAR